MYYSVFLKIRYWPRRSNCHVSGFCDNLITLYFVLIIFLKWLIFRWDWEEAWLRAQPLLCMGFSGDLYCAWSTGVLLNCKHYLIFKPTCYCTSDSRHSTSTPSITLFSLLFLVCRRTPLKFWVCGCKSIVHLWSLRKLGSKERKWGFHKLDIRASIAAPLMSRLIDTPCLIHATQNQVPGECSSTPT